MRRIIPANSAIGLLATWLICLFAVASVFGADNAKQKAEAGQKEDAAANLMEAVPANFPPFYFGGHEEEAELLSHYLWYHFSNRLGNGLTLFNKEYLLTADMWLADGYCDKTSQKLIQQIHRKHLLEVQFDREGYVQTHQHFSHAHDHGWPFPLWTQSDNHPSRVKGKTAGWHFQEIEHIHGWVKGFLKGRGAKEFVGRNAASLWELHNVQSLGIKDNRWHLKATGPSPAILTPKGVEIDAFNAPYLQLRWKRTGEPMNYATPYVEWQGLANTDFSPDRRVYFYPDTTGLSASTGCSHSIITMYRHPKWVGKIKRIRIVLAPGESDAQFEIDSFFTVYDTRHSINNPIFILASKRYFDWTGDLDFLRKNINRMRLALWYQQTVMGAVKYNRIRNPWPGHDGLAGWKKHKDGSKTFNAGHGIGNNYWDLMPFGFDDMYATAQYYAATQAMAEIEDAISRHQAWNIPLGALMMEPQRLRKHAQAVKAEANRLFWNDKTGRFVACIDKKGNPHDYGYTFLNLDAIWYGIASQEHARAIMDWITGKRIVAGDTSTGQDIYRWRFGPRATTLRNVDWYGQAWFAPETIPWGGQIQDGGAVLGFTFYDLWARLQVLGPENAWQRLIDILTWEKEVAQAGGYRDYYADGKQGTTLQGGGTAGGIGIDYEFYESSLLPSIVTYGFVGLDVQPDVLAIRPRLPKSCPDMGISNMLYRNIRMDIRASDNAIVLNVKDEPVPAIRIALEGKWGQVDTEKSGSSFVLAKPGVYRFEKLQPSRLGK